jgi:branched-chain amino acid transport system ATP-binding protein
MILRTAGLNVRYGEAAVLHDIGIEVAKGQIITVIGPNGAGKTTLLNAIMGVHGGAGTLHFAGHDVTRMPVEARVRAGLSLVPEKRELFTTLPVEDNLRLGGFRFRREGAAATRRQLDEIYALFPRLRERRRQLAGTLSGGERQMLAMGRAMMSRPDLLMLDEPSLGLAPLIVREIFTIIADLKARSCSVLLVEQNARAALQVADYGYVLETGRITLQGPSADLAVDPRVIETYLGAVRAVPAPP